MNTVKIILVKIGGATTSVFDTVFIVAPLFFSK